MPSHVALRKESVDRNEKSRLNKKPLLKVALRKESVDRNVGWLQLFLYYQVALRKESVDRNFHVRYTTPPRPSRSPQGERG